MYLVENFQHVNYTNKQNQPVNGLRLVLSEEDNTGKWATGRNCDIVFVSSKNVDGEIEVGSSVDVFYNKYGNVTRVVVLG